MVLTTATAVLVGGAYAWLDGPAAHDVEPMAGPGHGRGLSQAGAFDHATEGGTAEEILAHYYPGATIGAIGPTSLAVRLTGLDDEGLDAYAEAGARVAGRVLEPGQVAHLTPLPDGGANVVVTLGCDGDVLWQTATTDPWLYPLDPNPGRPASEHLTLCGGGAYRGALGVAAEDGGFRTVNRVDVEDYLLGVVPAEMQANWADKGANEALRAQAIAARSYALAESRYPYAQTCDSTDCQVYPGTEREDPRSSAAVASTAGQVLLRDGHILRAEYSAAPDGGRPADIQTFEVGPTPAELAVVRPPVSPGDLVPVPAGEGASPEGATPERPSLIDIEYARRGGPSSSLGDPLGPESPLPRNAGTYRLFSNGVIVATELLGAQVVDFDVLLSMIPGAGALDEPAGPDRAEGTPVEQAAPESAPAEQTAAPDGAPAPEAVPVVGPQAAGQAGFAIPSIEAVFPGR
ncbi:MAG TPA: SpoIID/LytB domain-containing protein [Nocardia sp.]|uniref:SpoIID/LytB domain-containing protein n=1 Tax=Nocardia TaxID=1817 RepID=UPI0024546C76|nr:MULTISPECIES: SpoIID/LytB domain-containing protein [Nocardia]HLS75331.1 SpoIID/LytB domain-containing protein [Nocardia sp.]